MAEYIDNVVSVPEREEEKIKTPLLHIVVGGALEKPYYSILWVDCETQEFQLGYSSYCLDYVREWRDKYFEITTEDFPAADVVKVKHGRWIKTRCLVGGFHDVWGSDCSECGTTVKDDYPNYCPNCGAKMEAK